MLMVMFVVCKFVDIVDNMKYIFVIELLVVV